MGRRTGSDLVESFVDLAYLWHIAWPLWALTETIETGLCVGAWPHRLFIFYVLFPFQGAVLLGRHHEKRVNISWLGSSSSFRTEVAEVSCQAFSEFSYYWTALIDIPENHLGEIVSWEAISILLTPILVIAPLRLSDFWMRWKRPLAVIYLCS